MNRVRSFLAEYHPIVHSLMIGTVFVRAASSMSMPFLAIYLATNTGMNEVMIGLTIGASSLAGAFGGFVGGTLSDLFGRRRVMLGALYVWAIVFFGFAVGESPLLFLLLSVLGGLCRSFYEPVSQALMADVTESQKRLRVFSLRYMCINIGVAVGPLLGAYLALRGDSLPFLVTAVVYLLYVVSLQGMLSHFGIKQIEGQKKEPVSFRSTWQVVTHDVALRFFLIGGILVSVGYSQMTITLSQYVASTFVDGVKLFAVLMSVNAIAVVVMQYPLARWAEKRTPLYSIVVGCCFYALGQVGFAFSFNWSLFITSMIVFTIGEILTFPASNLFIDRLAPAEMRGAYFGTQSFTSLGQFIGPTFGGFLLAGYGGPIMFVTMAGITLLSILFYWGGQRQYAMRLAGTEQKNDLLRA
ncbi:MFS transporter [Brevibacillus humidisoli]|uniref:MDR family MFS transporter n=1 Tax=Brevibacillus humidisoli TaxID=2895522 RepID=UPI001E4C5607|nr:MFS transporter [Brevibacillus humidisoli]UFJ41661.1 MFS transporter [Brevibacillus humidisoli]